MSVYAPFWIPVFAPIAKALLSGAIARQAMKREGLFDGQGSVQVTWTCWQLTTTRHNDHNQHRSRRRNNYGTNIRSSLQSSSKATHNQLIYLPSSHI